MSMSIMGKIYRDKDGYARYDEAHSIDGIAGAVAEKSTGHNIADIYRACFQKASENEALNLEKVRKEILTAASAVDVSQYVLIKGHATSLGDALRERGISQNTKGLEIIKFQFQTTYSLGFEDEVDSVLILKKLSWMK